MILVAEASSTPQKGAAIGLDADGSGELFTVESYRDEDIRSDLVRVRQDTDEKIVSEAAGVLIATGADLD